MLECDVSLPLHKAFDPLHQSGTMVRRSAMTINQQGSQLERKASSALPPPQLTHTWPSQSASYVALLMCMARAAHLEAAEELERARHVCVATAAKLPLLTNDDESVISINFGESEEEREFDLDDGFPDTDGVGNNEVEQGQGEVIAEQVQGVNSGEQVQVPDSGEQVQVPHSGEQVEDPHSGEQVEGPTGEDIEEMGLHVRSTKGIGICGNNSSKPAESAYAFHSEPLVVGTQLSQVTPSAIVVEACGSGSKVNNNRHHICSLKEYSHQSICRVCVAPQRKRNNNTPTIRKKKKRLCFSFSILLNQVCVSYAYLSLGSASQKRISFTLAAITNSKYSRTSRRVWGDADGVILLCVLRRSRSSDVWRLCRVSVGLSLDYG
ncbi:hypothetical protein RIF29_31515 [Crotalaria pallida]|uniref:Uncharacterized protein n=1 Tax=Crotalaria pallida TaxID=3830 RepID=A0AAN9EJH5_CROPI